MSDTITVYRVEAARGETRHGPFQRGWGKTFNTIAENEEMLEPDDWGFHTEPRGFPSPHSDVGINPHSDLVDWSDYLCGARDLERLRRWFPKPFADALNAFEPGEWAVAAYEVQADAVAFGEAQTVFDPGRATRVRSEPITTLH